MSIANLSEECDPLLTYRQVADELKLKCVATVRNYIKAGRLKVTRVSKARPRISRRDLDEFRNASRE